MFQRFTERAREVVVLAQDEARALRHDYIGTEHILLGLLREEEGVAARVLDSLGIRLEEVRNQVARIVGAAEAVGAGQTAFTRPAKKVAGQMPFTPPAKKVLELALREALSLGHNYIGTEHILLGLIREDEGVAARILLDFDADAGKLRNEIIRMLTEREGAPTRPHRIPAAPSWHGRARRRAWEYRIEDVEELGEALLNEIGSEGWQLASILQRGSGYRVIFMRPRW